MTLYHSWAAGEVSKLLGFDDDVVIGLLFGLLEGGKHVSALVRPPFN